MLRPEQTQIPISKELRERLKELGRKGETYEEIITSLIEKTENKQGKKERTNTPIHADSTHTHNKIEDIITWIETNNPKGITREQIDNVIKDLKGFDTRTINKYEPIVLTTLKEKGYYEHPKNPRVLIRYDL
jgi:hypothetical protein